MRLFKGKIEDNDYIELPLDTILDTELLDSGTPYDEELKKTSKERLKECSYDEVNIIAFEKKYDDMLERVKEKLGDE